MVMCVLLNALLCRSKRRGEARRFTVGLYVTWLAPVLAQGRLVSMLNKESGTPAMAVLVSTYTPSIKLTAPRKKKFDDTLPYKLSL